jgi:hypothetical protein
MRMRIVILIFVGNIKKKKKSLNATDVGNFASHAHTPINSESSICRPSIENLTIKRRKINVSTLPPKFVSDDDEVSSRHSPSVPVPEVSMFHATTSISNVRKKGALMLGDILLLKLSELPLNKTPSKEEIDQIYREIESFGVDPQPLRERVDKYSKDVMDYLEMKASMSEQMSLNAQTCQVEEIELLRSERLSTKATLEADLHLAKSRMDHLKEKLHQLEMSVSQIESKQAKEDDVVKALEEELEVVKSTDVVDDMDVEVLNKIQTILETERSNLKDLKWM